ncbi:MAG: hypothetical protein MI806_00595 [Minwuiales bacterium]|nr:hypothetical protein [Minwuiales bacterium]
MRIYEQLSAAERAVVDGLIGSCRSLNWRQRHALFMSFAERLLARLLNESEPDEAELQANEVLSVTVAATLEQLEVNECDDGWCALHLLFSARDDHREMGLAWLDDHPIEWAVVEKTVQPTTIH